MVWLPTTTDILPIRCTVHDDENGSLVALEHKELPFVPQRTFWVFDATGLRGQHAHKNEHQTLFCLSGACRVEVSDDERTVPITLRPDGVGLYIPNSLWLNLKYFGPYNTLLVFSSCEYNQDDYIADWDEFLEFRKCGE
jgi:dTDP-4-dehydrorhamnose 3,5-epimerase-like enzyme